MILHKIRTLENGPFCSSRTMVTLLVQPTVSCNYCTSVGRLYTLFYTHQHKEFYLERAFSPKCWSTHQITCLSHCTMPSIWRICLLMTTDILTNKIPKEYINLTSLWKPCKKMAKDNQYWSNIRTWKSEQTVDICYNIRFTHNSIHIIHNSDRNKEIAKSETTVFA